MKRKKSVNKNNESIESKNRSLEEEEYVSADKEDKITSEITSIKPQVSLYEEGLRKELNVLLEEKETCDARITETKDYLQNDHGIYDSIKAYAENLHRGFVDGEEKLVKSGNNPVDYIIFDFENNEYYVDKIADMNMSEFYMRSSGDIHLCKENGIYVDYAFYAASSLFLTERELIEEDTNYIRAFEKIIDNDLDVCENKSRFSLFCMLPEAVDVFNTRIRRCLNTSKGRIVSIPKSIAVTYHVLSNLSIGDRFCVINLDGLHPVVTQLSIGKDDDGNKVILREGFIKNNSIKYGFISFAREYLQMFQEKYKVCFSENEINRLIFAKSINRVLTKHETIKLFRADARIDVVFDEGIYKSCLNRYVTKDCTFAKCSKVYVVSSIENLITGKNVELFNNTICYDGLKIIRQILINNENAVIWKEKLPRVSLEVIDDKTGRFSTVDLIDENNDGQNIRLSLDEEVELPFKGTITLQKGKKEYYLPLEREIYSDDINSAKEAFFYDKSLPLDRDIPVELVVKYNYLSESPIKLYARPKVKISSFTELINTWVDLHEIKAYAGATYEGHPKEMNRPGDFIFEKTRIGLYRFINGYADMTSDGFLRETRGQYDYHKELKALNSSYYYLRSTFDSVNIDDKEFINMYRQCKLPEMFELANKALNSDVNLYGQENIRAVAKYKYGIMYLFSDIVVASWYYDKADENTKQVYARIAKENEIKILARLSRCIQCKEDDTYRVFDKLSTQIKKYFDFRYKKDKHDQRLNYIRVLSQNCWFVNTWLYQFHNTKNGPEAIHLITEKIRDYLFDQTFRADKEYRDIMEFLVCLTMARNYDDTMFNPNDKYTRDLLSEIKISYEEALRQVDKESLVSRLEMEQDQGPLYGYHNYIYMLIVILSGEGQINLVGYHDD